LEDGRLRKAAALALAAASFAAAAGPLDFGRNELDQAIAERRLNPANFRVHTEYSLVLPEEGFQITGAIIRGGSLRGLMYGLLEAASQIRSRGALQPVRGQPKFPIRGVRRIMTDEDWTRLESEWRTRFTELARLRFNRFHLMFEGEPLTPERIEILKTISAAAREHAVELVVGLDDPTADDVMNLLAECESVRGIHVDADTAAYVSGPVSEAGRYVVLETTNVVKTAVPVPMRVAVEPGQHPPSCDAPCSSYTVFAAGEPPPANLPSAGFELLGDPGEAWMAFGYSVARVAAPVRRAPARKAPIRKK
jgi:hypothetical protein